MTSEKEFQDQLDQHPDDHHTRMVFADWLEEQGDPRAEGYRALGVLGHSPYTLGKYNPKEKGYGWSNTNNTNAFYPINHKLPIDWFTIIKDTHNEYPYQRLPQDHWRYHGSRQEADDQAAHAFSQLPEERKKEILSQNPIKFNSEKVLRYCQALKKLWQKGVEFHAEYY